MLRAVVSLALGNGKIGEVASLPSLRTDIARAIVERVPVLDPVNLDAGMTFFDGDRELVFWLFFHDVSACFHTSDRHAGVMQTVFLRGFA